MDDVKLLKRDEKWWLDKISSENFEMVVLSESLLNEYYNVMRCTYPREPLKRALQTSLGNFLKRYCKSYTSRRIQERFIRTRYHIFQSKEHCLRDFKEGMDKKIIQRTKKIIERRCWACNQVLDKKVVFTP